MKEDIASNYVKAYETLRKGSYNYILKGIIIQLLILFAGSILLELIFKWILISSSIESINEKNFFKLLNPAAIFLSITYIVTLIWLIYIEFSIIILLAYSNMKKKKVNVKEVLKAGLIKLRKLSFVELILKALFMILIIPLSNVGIDSIFTQNLFIPKFIIDEYSKTMIGQIVLGIIFSIIAYITIRMFYILVLDALNQNKFTTNMRISWNRTKDVKQIMQIIVYGTIYALRMTILPTIAVLLSLLIIKVIDAKAQNIYIQSLFLTILNTTLFVVIYRLKMFLVTFQIITLEEKEKHISQKEIEKGKDNKKDNPKEKNKEIEYIEFEEKRLLIDEKEDLVKVLDIIAKKVKNDKIREERIRKIIITSTISIFLIGLYSYNYTLLKNTVENEAIKIVAHRGYVKRVPENTIEALEEANKYGANYTEIDLLMTKDEKIIVMHDSNLKKLTGKNVEVGNLTLEEIEKIRIKGKIKRNKDANKSGDEYKIPTLEQIVEKAEKLNHKLFIEIKTHGKEDKERYIQILKEEFERLDIKNKGHKVISGNQYILEKIEEQIPEIDTGIIIAFHIGLLPHGNMDFYLLEDFSYTKDKAVQAKIQNKKIYVWTINDSTKLDKYIYSPVDGIITDKVELAVAKVKKFKKEEDNIEKNQISYLEKIYKLIEIRYLGR